MTLSSVTALGTALLILSFFSIDAFSPFPRLASFDLSSRAANVAAIENKIAGYLRSPRLISTKLRARSLGKVWVKYEDGQPVEVNATDCEDVDELKELVKQKMELTVPVDRITLCRSSDPDDGPVVLTSLELWDHVPVQQYTRNEAPIPLIVQLLGGPMADSSVLLGSTSGKVKVNDLSLQLKSFVNAKLLNGTIVSENDVYLPYPGEGEMIQKLYVRKCYEDIYDLLLEKINRGTKWFGISGTQGIGKSLFFLYVLFCIVNDSKWKPKRVVYQDGPVFQCFDLERHDVTELSFFDAGELVCQTDTFYVIDGWASIPRRSTCVTLFISSPFSDAFQNYVKQRRPTEWCFPLWTFDELSKFREHCYPLFPQDILEERFHVYGGVARFMFIDYPTNGPFIRQDPIDMEYALSDAYTVKRLNPTGLPNKMSLKAQTLLHMIGGEDSNGFPYQFLGFGLASDYVGEQLWVRHYEIVIERFMEFFAKSPNEVSRRLFEIYGHRIFSKGGQKLRCRDLKSETETMFSLDALDGQQISIDPKNLPEVLLDSYCELSGDEQVPVVDSLSKQGMFYFTMAAKHSGCGVQMLKKLCALYEGDRNLYFVVPPRLFDDFKEQVFLDEKGNITTQPVERLRQYVLELKVEKQESPFKSDKNGG